MSHSFAGKKVLITGATAGIGAATAEAFAAEGAHIIAVARREKQLHELAAGWRERHGTTVEIAVLDVTDRDAVVAFASTDAAQGIDILVNNAGLAKGLDPMQTADFADWQTMVDTNILGLLSLTREIVPDMIERGGHVVNLGSVAGRWVYPGGGVYAATKYAVRALSEGLRYDLQGHNVRVTNIEPGLVETEFSIVRFDGDEDRAAKVYADADVLRPEDIADTITWSCSRPEHVNIQEMVVYPTCQAGVRDVVRNKS